MQIQWASLESRKWEFLQTRITTISISSLRLNLSGSKGLTLIFVGIMTKSSYVGINSVDPSVLDASRGMGMTRFEILRMVEFPLALPVIMAGIKNIAVMTIGVAALAAVIGAGGLGMFVYNGINRRIMSLVLTGVIIMSILSIASETLLHRFEITLTPEHKRR